MKRTANLVKDRQQVKLALGTAEDLLLHEGGRVSASEEVLRSRHCVLHPP
jgi:hypothetical protein